MSDADKWLSIIKKVAEEQDFEVEGKNNKTTCTVYIDKWHAVAYQLKINRVGFVQAHQYECDGDGNERYGRAVYSIRSYGDCAQFCSILIGSSNIRAGREQQE